MHCIRQGKVERSPLCFKMYHLGIISMYERERDRVKLGLTRMVPKLKEVHIIRDAWTKLNVTPAKIMQVC